MYLIIMTITNPATGGSKTLKCRTDEKTFTAQKWAGSYAPVKTAMDELIAESATKEPMVL